METEKSLVFLDAFPLTKGHTLVIPKNHYAKIQERIADISKELVFFTLAINKLPEAPNQSRYLNWINHIRLMKDYEDSYFARLLNRTSTETLSTGKESESQKLYAEAYEYYAQNNFTDALTFVETGLKQYPNNQIEDKFVFLKALILAKTQTVDIYQKALKNFITDYPKSQLIAMAKERLDAVEKK